MWIIWQKEETLPRKGTIIITLSLVVRYFWLSDGVYLKKQSIKTLLDAFDKLSILIEAPILDPNIFFSLKKMIDNHTWDK